MKKTSIILTCLALMIMACGCSAIHNLRKRPQVTLERVTLTDASLFQGTLELTLNVSNPKPVGFRINEVTYRLDMEGKTVLEGSRDEGMDLRALGGEKLRVPLTVNYLESVDSLVDLFGKKSLAYQVSGEIRFIMFSLPYSHSGVITLPKPPTVSLKDVHVDSLGLTGARLSVTLDVVNDNPAPLDLKSVNYEVTLGGFRLMDGHSENIRVSEDQKNRTIKVPVSLNFLAMGKGFMELLSQGSLGYEISGDMVFNIPKLGLKSFPYKKTGQVGVTR